MALGSGRDGSVTRSHTKTSSGVRVTAGHNPDVRASIEPGDPPPVHVVADTNILIDFLRGIPAAKAELARYSRVTISHMTWMEVAAGANGDEEDAEIRAFLHRFTVHPIDERVAERA